VARRLNGRGSAGPCGDVAPADGCPADRRSIVSAAVTMAAALSVIGFVFGVGAVAAGASIVQTCLMSVLVFTGASQFSAVSVVASGGSTGAALGGAMLLAARNTVYGLAMSRHLGGSLPKRLVAAQVTIDETTAMALAQDREIDKRYAFWATALALFVFWNTGGLVGALVGGSIDPETFGLDVAFPAAYVAMVLPHLRHRDGLIAGIVGAVICVVLIPFTPVGVPILGAAAAILVGLREPAEPRASAVRGRVPL
jgi:4-azaleucine resistance transporter AzlC